jgi:SHS family sialic acid transporter-like MFS transporter
MPSQPEIDLAKLKGTERRRWYSGATHGQWLVLTAALLGWAFDGFEMGVFPLVARPALKELLQTGQGAAGEDAASAEKQLGEKVRRWNAVITAAFLVGAAVGGFLFGWIGDRIGRVRAMVFSVLTYALFTGFCGLAQAPWQLAVLRIVAALGMGGEWALGVALVMESWSAHARPVLAGMIGAAANFGFLCTGLVGLVLAPAQWWRLIFGLCVVPALLTFLLRMFVPESEKWEQAAASGPKPGLGDIFVPQLRWRSLIGAALGGIALLATWGGVQQIPLWAGGELAPHVNLFSSLGAVIGSFLGAVIGERFGRRLGYFTLCTAGMLVCEFLFVGQANTSFGSLFFFTVSLAGATSAAFYGWLPLYLPELFPTRVRAAGQGFCYNSGRCLAALGVVLTAFVINLEGNYAAAAALVCLVYVVGMILAWFIPETKGQPLPE